jgi:pSer/pThr/pTyr-binding forkhead associated (FHA) protein
MQVWLEINISNAQKSVLDITDKSIITIGSRKDRDVVLPIPTISRKQCDIRRYRSHKSVIFDWIILDGYFGTDGKIILPKYPTMINGQTYLDFRDAKLSNGDCIIFSHQEYPNIIFNNTNDKSFEAKENDTNQWHT